MIATKRWLSVGAALMAGPAAQSAGETDNLVLTAPRTELPISEVLVGSIERRYAVKIKLENHEIDAGLDTGSVGFRALPEPARAWTEAGGPLKKYDFGSGTLLIGRLQQGELGLGSLRRSVLFQAVQSIGCDPDHPFCPARNVPINRYGIEGDGLPGQGFRALLGVGLGAGELPNPLVALGVHRWIVTLPQPGVTTAGRLLLNPRPDEARGFVSLGLSRTSRSDTVPGCLERLGEVPICAPTIIDSGAPGIEVVNAMSELAWPQGTPASLTFRRIPTQAAASIAFITGRREQATRFRFTRDTRLADMRIRSGLLAYFAFDVLYDADRHDIAVRLRAAYPNGPLAKTSLM